MSEPLILDEQVMRDIATNIYGYCTAQKTVIDNFMAVVTRESAEWQDDVTVTKMLERVRQAVIAANELLGEISPKYPQYFSDKADQIAARRQL